MGLRLSWEGNSLSASDPRISYLLSADSEVQALTSTPRGSGCFFRESVSPGEPQVSELPLPPSHTTHTQYTAFAGTRWASPLPATRRNAPRTLGRLCPAERHPERPGAFAGWSTGMRGPRTRVIQRSTRLWQRSSGDAGETVAGGAAQNLARR